MATERNKEKTGVRGAGGLQELEAGENSATATAYCRHDVGKRCAFTFEGKQQILIGAAPPKTHPPDQQPSPMPWQAKTTIPTALLNPHSASQQPLKAPRDFVPWRFSDAANPRAAQPAPSRASEKPAQ